MRPVDLKRDVISILGGMLVCAYVFHHVFLSFAVGSFAGELTHRDGSAALCLTMCDLLQPRG